MPVLIGVEVEGLRELLRVASRLPKTAQNELRQSAMLIATDEAASIRAAAAGSSPQSAAVVGSIRARRDRVPAVAAGGAGRSGVSGGATTGQLFFGAEFGGQGRPTTKQFRPHRGTSGYWFFPTLRRDQERMMKRWETALRAVEREWSGGV
ncbi:MAG: hypothetical protein QM582_09550 [Micropruina sp.]|uniref:hypothetical protein n=1 Tax=Micropruina sp. TaxID=2737536 RepID=UPI0039E33FA2